MVSNHLLPILVEFSVGAVLCAIGIWCGISSGYLDLAQRRNRSMVAIIVAGYVGLLIFYGLFTFWLPFVPGEGPTP